MSYALRVCWLSLCLWSAALPLCAAQPAAADGARRVLLDADAIGAEDFSVLEGALAKLNASLERVTAAAPGCEPGGAPPAPGVRVWVSWQPTRVVALCFEDASGRHPRVLGPFDRLHGSAREQLMTVIESGLQAAEAAQAELAARAAEPDPAPPPPAAAPAAPPPPPPAEPRSWTPGASLGLGLTSWSSHALATQLMAAAGVRWLPRALDLRLELGLGPAFEVTGSDPRLALEARSWRVGAAVYKHATLYQRLGGRLGAGIALEHVHVKPQPHGVSLQSRRAVSHADPLLFARVGPSLELGAHFTLSIAVGVELLLHPRRYGFTVADSAQVVLDLAQLRASVLAEISAAL